MPEMLDKQHLGPPDGTGKRIWPLPHQRDVVAVVLSAGGKTALGGAPLCNGEAL